ncbi:L domain-like protein [Anaeromyces robustus]|uniref:L domain-like protein n=1 Tax=Anaeromyces robustus TaxID=1754192 RepID=A0A1Y1XE43_9FUNG|nr:L domain-like protein [Anaeromyces robustus]|eukprot:ORX84030.1 L domain-like protein [Anaeromyces robustus]
MINKILCSTLIIILYILQVSGQSGDCQYVISILNKLNIPESKNVEDCCSLSSYVTCSNGKVIKISLSNMGLTSVPEEISHLSSLKEINFSNNKISSIPESIYNLSNLDRMHFEYNDLTSLSSSIGKLTNLQMLFFDSNELSGIPQELFKLPKLTLLSLSANHELSLKMYNFGHRIQYCYVDIKNILCYDPGTCDKYSGERKLESATLINKPPCSNNNVNQNTLPIITNTNAIITSTLTNNLNILTTNNLSPTSFNDNNNNNNNNNNNINSLHSSNGKINSNSYIESINEINFTQEYNKLEKNKTIYVIIIGIIVITIIITDTYLYKRLYNYYKKIKKNRNNHSNEDIHRYLL